MRRVYVEFDEIPLLKHYFCSLSRVNSELRKKLNTFPESESRKGWLGYPCWDKGDIWVIDKEGALCLTHDDDRSTTMYFHEFSFELELFNIPTDDSPSIIVPFNRGRIEPDIKSWNISRDVHWARLVDKSREAIEVEIEAVMLGDWPAYMTRHGYSILEKEFEGIFKRPYVEGEKFSCHVVGDNGKAMVVYPATKGSPRLKRWKIIEGKVIFLFSKEKIKKNEYLSFLAV